MAKKLAKRIRAARKKFPALEATWRERHFYLTALPADLLSKIASVSRADEDPVRGYQRLLERRRAKRIAEYLREGNVVPGAVVLSAQKRSAFHYDSDAGTLSFNVLRGAFIVIDGQHRLYGAALVAEPVPLICTILNELSIEDEVKLFVDVNTTQRGVPKTLQLEVMKFTVKSESVDDIRLRLFKRLNEDPESPYFNLMSATKSVRGKLSHVPFKRVMDPILHSPPVRSFPFDQKYKIVLNLLNATEHILTDAGQDKQRMVNAAFFQAMMGAFREISHATFARFGNYKMESFLAVLAPIGEIDWASHAGTNKPAIELLRQEIIERVDRDSPTSNDDLV